MKKINLVLGTMAIAACGFISCSDDDNDGASVKISGTYELNEVNTENATDFNMDGTANVNQVKESSCYDDGRITLNDDGTLKFTITKILIDETDGSTGCAASYQASGLWQANSVTGSTTTITAVYTDQSGNNQSITLVKNGNELTYKDDTVLSSYPDRNANDEAVYTLGSTTYVFKK